jgi:hypothetical protein
MSMRQIAGFLTALAGAAALVACATPASAPPAAVAANAPAIAPVNAPAPATASNAPAVSATDKAAIPYGYERVVLGNGEERFCRNDLITGSRTQHQKVCLTMAQLQASEKDSQDFINNVQAHGGMATSATTPGAGGAMGGR